MGLLSSNDLGGKQHRRDGSTDTQHPSTASRDREVMRWAPPISVALTLGISVDFFYLRLLICLNLAGHLPTDEVQCRSASSKSPLSKLGCSTRPGLASAGATQPPGHYPPRLQTSSVIRESALILESLTLLLGCRPLRPPRAPRSTAAAAEAARKVVVAPFQQGPSRHHPDRSSRTEGQRVAVGLAAQASARRSSPASA